MVFVPGDRHVLAGLKDGKLVIVDVAAGDVLEEIVAHSKDLRTICLTPDLVSKAPITYWTFFIIIFEQNQPF